MFSDEIPSNSDLDRFLDDNTKESVDFELFPPEEEVMNPKRT